LFHDFHQTWTIAIRNALNGGLLPKGYSALAEQHAPALIPDVLAVQSRSARDHAEPIGGGVLTAVRPKVRYTFTAEQSMAVRANRVTIRHSLGRIVCIIRIV